MFKSTQDDTVKPPKKKEIKGFSFVSILILTLSFIEC
jgi:hypothetical protein